jgi:SAM-dependent methyltransferase
MPARLVGTRQEPPAVDAQNLTRHAGAGTSDSDAEAAERIRSSGRFGMADIELLARTFARHDQALGTPWDDFRYAHLELPAWFRHDLEPLSADYARQQQRLWAEIAGVPEPYDPGVHEKEAQWQGDVVRQPGVYIRRDPEAVLACSDHIIATGMILKHSGLKPGDTALEYGAGFAQTALQLARLGVRVDTVDISAVFCAAVKSQADFFQVPLTPHEGRFGWNPRGEHRYDLIWFYESFHHCVAFREVVHEIRRHLSAGGRVLLAGEPIVQQADLDVPFPWGVRQGSEVVATIRNRHWFELGFTEDFLVGLFVGAGFTARKIECPVSRYGEGYVFSHRGEAIDLSEIWLPHDLAAQWHPAEPSGRWTKAASALLLDTTPSYRRLIIDVSNHHPVATTLQVLHGERTFDIRLAKGERRTVTLAADDKSAMLNFRCRTLVPSRDYADRPADDRELGVFVHKVTYA